MLRTKLILALTILFFSTNTSFSQGEFVSLLKQYTHSFKAIESFSVVCDSNNVSYSLSYYTPEIEVIKSIGLDSVSFWNLFKEKKNFHYFELSYIDKNQSLITEEARKDFLKEKLLSSITIKNEEGKDVKFNKQFFPSRFQGMPNKIIVVVPSIGFQEQINAEVNVESMIQLQLIVSLDKIKTLPKISI